MMLFEPRWKAYIIETNEPIFTKEQCEHIIRVGQSMEQKKAEVGIDTVDKEGKKLKPEKGIIDPKKRITTISWLPFGNPDTIPMYQKIEGWVRNINSNHFGFDGIRVTENAQYTEYPEGAFYDWHTDSEVNMSKMPPVRKISMTLLLSDEKDFEGGDLELIDDKSRPKMKQGHALFFASFIRHRVTPVTKGNRKSLVMWFGGPPFK